MHLSVNTAKTRNVALTLFCADRDYNSSDRSVTLMLGSSDTLTHLFHTGLLRICGYVRGVGSMQTVDFVTTLPAASTGQTFLASLR